MGFKLFKLLPLRAVASFVAKEVDGGSVNVYAPNDFFVVFAHTPTSQSIIT